MNTNLEGVAQAHEAAVEHRALAVVSFQQAVRAHQHGRGRGEIASHTRAARRQKRAADLYDQLAVYLAAERVD